MNESSLLGRRFSGTKSSEAVQHQKVGEPDSGGFRCGQDPFRHLRGIGIVLPIDIMMQVVEFTHRSVSCLEHFQVKLGGDRFHILRRKHLEEMVHPFAPAPERILLPGTRLGQPCHSALERMGMQIRHPRHHRPLELMFGFIHRTVTDAGDVSEIVQFQQLVFRPAV